MDLYTFKRRAFKRKEVESESESSDDDFETAMAAKKKPPKMAKEAEPSEEIEALKPVVEIVDDVSDDEPEIIDVEDAATQRRIKLLQDAQQAQADLANAELERYDEPDEPDEEPEAPEAPPEPAAAPGVKLRIFVRCDDKQAFEVVDNEPLTAVFEDFAAERGVRLDDCTFTFDGEKIAKTATPKDLDLEDEDMIDAVAPPRTRPKSVPKKVAKKATPAAPATTKPHKGDKVTLVVAGEHDKPIRFKIREDDPFAKVYKGYSKARTIKAGALRLLFNGIPIEQNQSPFDLGIKGDARIVASV